MLARCRDDDPLIPVVRLRRAALTERLGHTDEAMRELQQHRAATIPTARCPPCSEGDMLRSKQRFAEAVAAYDRAIAPDRRRRRRSTGRCSTIAASR